MVSIFSLGMVCMTKYFKPSESTNFIQIYSLMIIIALSATITLIRAAYVCYRYFRPIPKKSEEDIQAEPKQNKNTNKIDLNQNVSKSLIPSNHPNKHFLNYINQERNNNGSGGEKSKQKKMDQVELEEYETVKRLKQKLM